MDGAEVAKKTLVSFANDLRNAALIRARLDGITEKSFNMQAEKSIKRSMTSPSRAAEATATDRGQRKPRRIGELCTSSLQRNNNLQSNFHAMLQLFVGESQGRHVDTSLGIPFFLYEEAQDKLSSATDRSLELEVELEVTRDRVKLSEAELQYLRDTLKERRAYHEKNLTEAVRRLEEEVDFWKSQSKNEAERNSELESHMQREAERKEHLFRQQLTVKTNELQKIHESQLNVLKQSIVEEHARCSELQELVEEKILYIEKSAIRERETIEEIKEDFESRLREERFQREASHKRELGALHTRIQELTRGSVEADQKLNRVVCALSSTWTRIGIVPPLSMTNLINDLILAPPNLPNGSNDPTEWISNTLTGVFALRDARDVQVGEHKIAGPHALHPSLSSGYETSGTFSMEKRILKLEEQLCLAHDMLSEKTAHPDPAGIQQVFKPGSNLRTEIHELFCLESRDCKEMATEFSVSASSRRMQEYDTSGQSHKHSHISINPVWVTQAFCLFSSMEESGSLVHREHLSARNLEENAAATAQRGSHLETIREGDGTRLRRGQVMAEGELTADIASFSEWTNLSHSALTRIDLDREGMSQNESCRGERKSRDGKERSGMERTFFKEGTEFGKSLPSSERGSTGMVAESNSDHHTLEIPQAAPLRASTTSTATTTTTTTNSLLIQDSKKTESRRSSHRRRAKLSEDSEHIHPTANPDTSKGKVIHRTLYSYSKQPRDLEQDPEKRRVETEYSDPMMKYVAQSRSETIDQVAHFFSEMLATHNRLTEACNEFRSVAVYQLNFPTIQDGDVTSWSTLSHRLLEECHFAERTLRALRKEPCFSSQGSQLSNLQRSTRNYSEDRKRGGGGLKFNHMRNLKKSVFLRRSNVIEAPHRKPVVAQTYRELVNHRSQAPNPPWANEGIFNRMNFNGFLPPLNIRPNVTRFAGNTL